jgi:hypothetical protein
MSHPLCSSSLFKRAMIAAPFFIEASDGVATYW